MILQSVYWVGPLEDILVFAEHGEAEEKGHMSLGHIRCPSTSASRRKGIGAEGLTEMHVKKTVIAVISIRENIGNSLNV